VTGILLLNLGGPDTQEAVEPFLYNLFSDREIIQLPGGPLFQPAFARLIARLRGPKVRANYRSIGGGSPIAKLTAAQAAGLEALLNGGPVLRAPGDGPRFRVAGAMRYWRPTTEEGLKELLDAGAGRIIALTLYPHYSAATTGSSLNELRRVAARMGVDFTAIDRYADHPLYLEAVADTVTTALAEIPEAERRETVLLFSAHGLPIRFIRSGDPYLEEIARTREGVLAILRRKGIPNPWRQGYQSRTGPVRWVEPYTDRVIAELAREGVRSILVVPIAFVSDHIETLYEVDQLFAGEARRLGIPGFRRTRMLNDHPLFLAALADLVRKQVQAGPVTTASKSA
jgi:ferrochelatase